MMRRTLTLALLGTFLWSQSGFATVYQCVGPSGNVYYTDSYVSHSCKAMVLKRYGVEKRQNYGTESLNLRAKAARFEKFISYYGARYNVDPLLVRAVIRTESAFDPKAVSKKGAQGLMQLMPGTAKDLKVKNVFDPEENIKGGTRYLRQLLNTFSNDLKLALAAYNAGPTLVKREKGIPPYPETQKYVYLVMKYYKEYKRS